MHRLFIKNLFYLLIISLPFISSCEKKDSTIIDSAGNASILTDAKFSSSIINTDTINVGPERRPDDLLTIRVPASVKVKNSESEEEIKSVTYSVVKDFSSSPNGGGILHNDGIFPDLIANDSIFSGYVVFQITRIEVGNLWVAFSSKNWTGYESNTILTPLQIIRANQPPVISDLIAPDTVNLADQISFIITLKVIDPDGQSDIKSVLRFTPSGLMPQLYAINDSIYGETVSLNPAPKLGAYIFRFRAADRSNDSSNVLYKTIVVTKEVIN